MSSWPTLMFFCGNTRYEEHLHSSNASWIQRQFQWRMLVRTFFCLKKIMVRTDDGSMIVCGTKLGNVVNSLESSRPGFKRFHAILDFNNETNRKGSCSRCSPLEDHQWAAALVEQGPCRFDILCEGSGYWHGQSFCLRPAAGAGGDWLTQRSWRCWSQNQHTQKLAVAKWKWDARTCRVWNNGKCRLDQRHKPSKPPSCDKPCFMWIWIAQFGICMPWRDLHQTLHGVPCQQSRGTDPIHRQQCCTPVGQPPRSGPSQTLVWQVALDSGFVKGPNHFSQIPTLWSHGGIWTKKPETLQDGFRFVRYWMQSMLRLWKWLAGRNSMRLRINMIPSRNSGDPQRCFEWIEVAAWACASRKFDRWTDFEWKPRFGWGGRVQIRVTQFYLVPGWYFRLHEHCGVDCLWNVSVRELPNLDIRSEKKTATWARLRSTWSSFKSWNIMPTLRSQKGKIRIPRGMITWWVCIMA